LSKELGISRRTIQCVVIAVKGKRFRDLREEIFLARVESLLMATPGLAIKELSFQAGYSSTRSFARAVRRACGRSPEQLRAHIATDQLTSTI
jgi:AraC-like DNA-binding protein